MNYAIPEGVSRGNGGNVAFLQIWNNTLCQKNNREGFVNLYGEEVEEPVTIEYGKPDSAGNRKKWTGYFTEYPGLTGYVTHIKFHEHKDTQSNATYFSWKIGIDLGPAVQDVEISIPFNSNPSSRFMKLAGNIDFDKPVYIAAWEDKESKGKTAFMVKQPNKDGQNVPQLFGAEKEGGIEPEIHFRDYGWYPLPPAEKLPTGWNYAAQEKFLYDYMINHVIPAVDAAEAARAPFRPAKTWTPPARKASNAVEFPTFSGGGPVNREPSLSELLPETGLEEPDGFMDEPDNFEPDTLGVTKADEQDDIPWLRK